MAVFIIGMGFGAIIGIGLFALSLHRRSLIRGYNELRSCYMKLTPKDTDKIYYLIICFAAIYFMYHIGRYLAG